MNARSTPPRSSYGRNVPVGVLIAEKLKQFPARNEIWSYHEETNTFSTEASTLAGSAMDKREVNARNAHLSGPLDPWNRPMPARGEPFYHGRGEDQELAGYTYITTVDGVHVELTVFND